MKQCLEFFATMNRDLFLFFVAPSGLYKCRCPSVRWMVHTFDFSALRAFGLSKSGRDDVGMK